MSERGLILALQRIHDDPGFTDRVSEDPESTLGIYDLDEDECKALIDAVKKRDAMAIRGLATKAGIDWTAEHIGGIGALDEAEVSTERTGKPGIKGPGALSGDGYEGVQPTRPAGT